jgi:hypothetical protein
VFAVIETHLAHGLHRTRHNRTPYAVDVTGGGRTSAMAALTGYSTSTFGSVPRSKVSRYESKAGLWHLPHGKAWQGDRLSAARGLPNRSRGSPALSLPFQSHCLHVTPDAKEARIAAIPTICRRAAPCCFGCATSHRHIAGFWKVAIAQQSG